MVKASRIVQIKINSQLTIRFRFIATIRYFDKIRSLVHLFIYPIMRLHLIEKMLSRVPCVIGAHEFHLDNVSHKIE